MPGFGDTWLISVMMRFSSNGSRVMAEMAAATRTANAAVEAQTAKVNAATLAMQRFRAEAIGVGLTVAKSFAIAGAAVGAYSVAQAATLQRTLTAIGNETGAGGLKLDRFRAASFEIANQIGVAPQNAAEILLNISRLTAGQLQVAQMLKVAPSIARFASVLNYNRPDVSVEDATQAGLQLVHLFRAYQPAQLVPLLDKVYRLSGLMAEQPSQAVRQMSYYEPLFKGLKIDENSSIAMMALLDRAGFRMKVGTNVRAMLLQALGPLQLTTHAQAAKLGYLEQMGIFNKSGRFAWNLPGGGVNFMGMLDQMSRWTQGQEARGVPASDLARVLYSVFGKQGGTIAQLMADPQMTAFLGDIRTYLANPNVGLAAGARNRENTLSFQAGRAWGNFKADLTELGWVTLPQLTSEFRHLGDTLHGVQAYLHQHRTAENWIAGGVAGITGLSAAALAIAAFGKAIAFVNSGFKVLGAAKLLQFGGDIAALNNPLTSASGGLRALAGALRFVSGPLTVLAAFDNARATPLGSQPSWSGLSGMSQNEIRDYIHRTGWSNITPDVRDHWRATEETNHITQSFTVMLAPGTTADQAKQIVQLGMAGLNRGIRSARAASGRTITNPSTPRPMHLELTSPNLGLY
jgi:hypothetical protein